MVHIKRKQFGSTFCGLAGGQFYDWTLMENLKNYDEDKLCPDCFLRLVKSSAEMIPAIPPEDYKGSQADWMVELQERGLWDGKGWHGDIEIPTDDWWGILEECEGDE